MSAEVKKEIQLEIAHVLFIDIVDYSNLVINEQRALLDTLNQVVRGTDQFRSAEAAGRLIKIPTGDGMALIFYNSPEAPVECALEISRALKQHPELRLRMGVHSGPVSGVIDVNEQANVTGAGINVAQRVMDCGDAGHILLSKHVAEDLEQYSHWRPHLHDLGECEVKHGARVHVVNLYTEELGNPEMPEKFKQAAGARKAAAANPGPIERTTARRWAMIGAVFLMIAAVGSGLLIFLAKRSPTGAGAITSTPTREKSIAVLPFENLSEDKANAYFASGMGGEILTKLAQLAELKVISRTSTEKYQSHPDDLKAVGRQLGVSTVLEGSVQKAGDDVLINVRLIDAQTESHLWAQSYTRTLKNIFEVEGEVAGKVAEALKVKLVPAEAQRLVAPGTTNPNAHDLYLRAHAVSAHSDEQSLEQTITLLHQALAEDSHYGVAWAELADTYLAIADAYRAPLEILGPAQRAALMAVASDEQAAAGHICLGELALMYARDFPIAKRELERAVALNPNSSDALRWHGLYLARVERDFIAAQAELERAQTLDPFYTWVSWAASAVAIAHGDYEAAMRFAERILAIDPHFLYDEDPIAHVYVAMGRWQDGVKRYQSLPASTLRGPNFELAVCYAHTGETARAKQILNELEALARRRYVDQTHIAGIYAALGDKDKAFAALERACSERSARVSAPRFYPWLAPLTDDPRFAALEYKVTHSAIVLPAEPESNR